MSADDRWDKADVARDYIVDHLLADRWDVEPTDAIEMGDGRGPRTLGRQLVLPDLRVTKNRHSLAVEVKAKTEATFTRFMQKLEHGVDRYLFDDYRDYDRLYLPTFIVIVELGHNLCGRDTYCARVSALRVRTQRNERGTMMAYWPREQMTPDWLLKLNRSVNQQDWPDARRQGEQGELF